MFNLKFASIVFGTILNIILFIWFLYRYEFIYHNHPTGIIYSYCISNLISFFVMLLLLYVVMKDKLKQTFDKYDQLLEDKKKI